MPYTVSTYPLVPATTPAESYEATVEQLLRDVTLAHLVAIAVDGGSPEIRDPNLLLSAISRPFTTVAGKLAYRSGIEQAAALMESLIGNHPFVDGNKRTGMMSTLYMLEACKYWRDVAFLSRHEVEDLKDLTLKIARGEARGQAVSRELHHILRPSRNRSIRLARLLAGEFKIMRRITFNTPES